MAEEKIEEEVNEQGMQDAIAEGIDSVLDGDNNDNETPAENEPPEQEEAEGGEDKEEPRGEGEPEEKQEPESVEGSGADGEGDEGAPDYTVPEGLNERSTERFNRLVEDNKAKAELVHQHEETLNGMRQLVQDSGLSNEEYLSAIDFASQVKRDPAAGVERMKSFLIQTAKENGIPLDIGEVDYFEDFPDLKQSVEDMEITQQHAIEVAKSRRQAAQANQQRQQSEQQSQNEAQYNQARDAATKDVAEYIQGLVDNDIDWNAKAPIMTDVAKSMAQNGVHPSQWLPTLKQEYDRIERIAKAVAPRKRDETPLTDTSQARGGNKVPNTIEEALDQLL